MSCFPSAKTGPEVGTALAGIKSCKIDIQEKVNAIKKPIAIRIQQPVARARAIPDSTPGDLAIRAATRTKTGTPKW